LGTGRALALLFLAAMAGVVHGGPLDPTRPARLDGERSLC